MSIHIYFLIEALLRLFAAQNFRSYFFSLQNIIDILTIIPYIIIRTIMDPMNFWSYFVRMLDLLRILILFRALKYIENDINRELFKILIGAFALTIGYSGYIHLIQYDYNLTSGDLTGY